ncbi:diguanylate phosphodiesterase [Pseudomonas putida]|nr:diguanylate phosphodiesterase [Pseudomonas putida]
MWLHPRSVRRSGFTREYGSGGNGERPVEIGRQGWPFRG